MKTQRKTIQLCGAIGLLLLFVFMGCLWGCGKNQQPSQEPQEAAALEMTEDEAQAGQSLEQGEKEKTGTEKAGAGEDEKKKTETETASGEKESGSKTGSQQQSPAKAGEEPAPSQKPAAQEEKGGAQKAQENQQEPARLTCEISVSCETVLSHLDELNEGLRSLIPQNGVMLSVSKAEFTSGESAFDLLKRELDKAGIHFEYVNTPGYGSSYVEGIGNLYEFDCGSLSGWLYKVNGQFTTVASSEYQLQAGDVIQWVYTCDGGGDVGGSLVGG